MKKILLLGSNSFAGTTFIEYLLKKKYKVFSTSRSKEKEKPFDVFRPFIKSNNYRFYKININKKPDRNYLKNLINKNKIKNVVDFGSQSMVGQSWIKPEDWVRTNCLGKLNLIKTLNEIKDIKYIRISTPEVYGENKNKIKENDKIFPSTPYAITQSTADFFTYAYTSFMGFNSITLRFANFYGPGQQLYRIIPKTIMCILEKKKLNLEGGGKSKRSFIFADDFCDAILLSIKKGATNETYNFSPNSEIKIIELVKQICRLMNYSPKKLINFSKDRIGKDSRYFMATNKVRKELGWRDEVKLLEGLKKTISWYKNNFEILKKLNQNYIHKK